MKKKFRAADLMSTELYYDLYGKFEEMLNKVIEVEYPDDFELKSLSIIGISENPYIGFKIPQFIFKAEFTKDEKDTAFMIHDDSSKYLDFYLAHGIGGIIISASTDKGKSSKHLEYIKENNTVVKISY